VARKRRVRFVATWVVETDREFEVGGRGEAWGSPPELTVWKVTEYGGGVDVDEGCHVEVQLARHSGELPHVQRHAARGTPIDPYRHGKYVEPGKPAPTAAESPAEPEPPASSTVTASGEHSAHALRRRRMREELPPKRPAEAEPEPEPEPEAWPGQRFYAVERGGRRSEVEELRREDVALPVKVGAPFRVGKRRFSVVAVEDGGDTVLLAEES
jgi:hypothetical protein